SKRDWSSDVCSSDLGGKVEVGRRLRVGAHEGTHAESRHLAALEESEQLLGENEAHVLGFGVAHDSVGHVRVEKRPAAFRAIEVRSEERRVGEACESG